MFKGREEQDCPVQGWTTLRRSDILAPQRHRSWEVVAWGLTRASGPHTVSPAGGPGQCESSTRGSGQGGRGRGRAKRCAGRWSRVQDERHPFFSLDFGPWSSLDLTGEILEPQLGCATHSQCLQLPWKPCSNQASQEHLRSHQVQLSVSQAKSPCFAGAWLPPTPRLITVIICCLTW